MNHNGTATPIFTIGYGARDIDRFIGVLKAYEIGYLIDVRSVPYSRYKPEFSRKQLEYALKAQDIRYVYMGDTLGGQPDDPDCYEAGKVVYSRVREKAFYRQGIDRVQVASAQGLRVVLMCSEGKPEMCHRAKLIGDTLAKLGIDVAHIDENDELRTQEEVEHRLTGGQLSLFGEQNFTSRKRYEPGSDDDA